MSVICDKQDGHFSLIPNEYKAPVVRRWWDGRNQGHVIEIVPDSIPPPAPESISKMICATEVVAFPLAAQMFQFHDFVIKAAGLPYDIDSCDDNEEDKKKIGTASNVVFECSGEFANTYDISCALDALHMSEFNMKSVSTSDLDLLRTTMDELLSSEDTIDEADKDVLMGGMKVIDNHFKGVSTHPMVEVPDDDGPPMNV
jgi:hypothetical protein